MSNEQAKHFEIDSLVSFFASYSTCFNPMETRHGPICEECFFDLGMIETETLSKDFDKRRQLESRMVDLNLACEDAMISLRKAAALKERLVVEIRKGLACENELRKKIKDLQFDVDASDILECELYTENENLKQEIKTLKNLLFSYRKNVSNTCT